MRKMGTYKTHISQKDESMFAESICIFKNIDFKEIWEHESLGEEGKQTIWNYLQTLYVIGDTIISDSNRIKNLLENFKKTRENNSESVDQVAFVIVPSRLPTKSSTLVPDPSFALQ